MKKQRKCLCGNLILFDTSLCDTCIASKMSIERLLFNRQKGKCYFCGNKMSLRISTIDHLTPTSRGGHNTPDNLALACVRCNQEKRDLTDKEYIFYKYLEYNKTKFPDGFGNYLVINKEKIFLENSKLQELSIEELSVTHKGIKINDYKFIFFRNYKPVFEIILKLIRGEILIREQLPLRNLSYGELRFEVVGNNLFGGFETTELILTNFEKYSMVFNKKLINLYEQIFKKTEETIILKRC